MSTERKTYRLRTTVHHSLRDRPILQYLSERFQYHPPSIWRERVTCGRVLVNGRPVDEHSVVRRDDLVEYTVVIDEPLVDRSYDAVYEDGDLLIVSKSGNIPVHSGGRYIGNTLIAVLRAERGRGLALSHRLDCETSGLVVMTKTADARRAMSSAFEAGAVRKTYLAIVRGVPQRSSFSVSVPLRKIGRQHPVPRTVADRRAGKPSATMVRVLETFGAASLLQVDPRTGRTNQIRAHLEISGHPIIGDKTYGVPARLIRSIRDAPRSTAAREHLILTRHALHAARLRFDHPITGAHLDVAATLPADLRRFLWDLRRT